MLEHTLTPSLAPGNNNNERGRGETEGEKKKVEGGMGGAGGVDVGEREFTKGSKREMYERGKGGDERG